MAIFAAAFPMWAAWLVVDRAQGLPPPPSVELLFGLIAPIRTSGILGIAPTVRHPLDLRRPRVVPELAGPRLSVQRDIRRNAATLLVFTS